MCALLATLFSTPTAHAADVEPLRSADLESRLKSAGFDDAQRAKILADYAAYVQRYSTSVAALIIEWQGLAGVQPSSIEEARTRQSKGRAAAQAIDDAERPLLDAIRGAARTDQTAAVNQLLMLLEIRRDLAFSSTLRDGMFARKAVDIFEIADGADFSAEKRVVLKPFLDQYLVERQAIVRRLRDATLNVPLRRFDAKQKHPLPTQPQADPNSPDPKQFQADIQAWFQAQETVSEAIMKEALAERSAARTKSIELDLRTIDSMLPLLSGREQAKLLAQWKNDAGSFFQNSDHGPSKLSRAWTTSPTLITPEVATQLDAICANWVTEWWPSAKESALVTTNGNQFAMFGSAVNDDGSEKADKGAAATDRAAAAIAALLDPKGDAKHDPKTVAISKPGIRLQDALGDVQIVGAEQGQGGQEVQAVISSVMVFADAGDAGGMALNLEGMEFEGIEMQGGGFMIEGAPEGMGMGEGLTIELDGGAGGFSRPNPLPKLMRFEDIKPVLAAAGVDETMMAVSETAIDDLLSDAREITEAAKASQTGSSMMPDGMFEQGPDGSIKLVDPAVRAQRVADREALRAELLALETSKLDEILPSVVPEAGRPVVSWLTAWRQLESERAAASGSGDVFSGRSQHDPVQSVFSSKLSSSDWKAVGPELAAVCADLASRTHAYVTASSKAQAASPLPQFAEQNGGAIQQGQAVMADGNMEGFMKLQQEAQRANKAAQTAANDAIPRLKSRLSPEAAQRLQDAWDDQLYSRDLKDATDLSDRFDSALAMVLTDPVRQQVITLQTSWRTASRLIRDRIVAVKSKPTADVIAVEDAAKAAIARRERTAELTAIKFERDEQNRRVFRELSGTLGADLAAKLAPLPESKKNKLGGGIGSMMGGASVTIPSPPPENPSPK